MAPDRTRVALRSIAQEEPDLGAQLVLMTLPAAASRIEAPLAYTLAVEGMGSWRVSIADGAVGVDQDGDGEVDFRLRTDPRALTELAAGVSPLRLMLSGRLRVRGSRLQARKLRAMSDGDLSLGEVVRAGGRIEPDLLYRALPYLIDPDWTRGHSFAVCYRVEGEGEWYVHVRDGQRLAVSREAPEGVAATATVSADTYQQLASGELSPSEAMQRQLTSVDGEIYPVTLLGRWIDRAQGRDEEELARELHQRRIQEARAGAYAAGGDGAGPSQGDPGTDSAAAGGRRGLLDYRQLYALWERQNWRASELDFSVDREHWATTPRPAQENTVWSLGSFYVGEERVTADLAPFLLAAPSGEVEVFLATQLVDEARHAAFFDRFGAEVMALSADDLRGRMQEVEGVLLSPWREVFDDGLRDVARRIKERPDDIDLFVEGIATYHLVIEGFLAVTGQAMIRDYMVEHSLYPGFCEGFGLVERDEHRHIAFGVRFLRDAIEQEPRHASTVERTVLDLAPRAAYVFCPPYVEDPREFVSYGYHSSEIYGYAYRTLKRRMRVLGIDIPAADEFMPGPIAEQPV